MTIYAYCRVSTSDQTTENQVLEMDRAGFHVSRDNVFADTVSGSTPAMERPEFADLVTNYLQRGDTLIVVKIDRLGRNAKDILQTVEAMESMGVRIRCLALGGVDMTSPAGKMITTVLAALAQLEKDQLVERTRAGLARTKNQGKVLGAPTSYDHATALAVRQDLDAKLSIRKTAAKHGLSAGAVQNIAALDDDFLASHVSVRTDAGNYTWKRA